jgi:hypothetical protein
MPRALWDATATADIVTIPARTVLALEGKGAPEGTAFQKSVAALYGVAYTLKFARKKAALGDFKIGPLETRWWSDDPARVLPQVARSQWRWQLRLPLPDDVTMSEVSQSIEAATHRKGGKLAGSAEAARITCTVLGPARYGRVLHVGPYSAEGDSFTRIADAVRAAGLTAGRAHSEVYLNQPGRTKPERLKTVLLLELA